MLRIAAQDLARLREIARVLARHGYRGIAADLSEGQLDTEDPAVRAEAARLTGPERLRKLLQALGPTFIKLGQVLSSRPDLVPSRYQPELARLQDDVEPLPYEVIEAALVEAWGGPVRDHLAEIDPQPLATASIAQVHRATLPDGAEVVVKVQRPNITRTIRADLDLLYLLARLIDATIQEAGLYKPVEVVRAFEAALLEELDFTVEARNARAIGANFEDDARVLVPAIVDGLSGRTVLTMQYVEGRKITTWAEDADDADVERVLRTVLDIAFKMGFQDGLFHADPHPGNVLVTPDGRICILDFGLAGRLTANMQRNLIQLSMAIASRDAETTARLIYRIGRPLERVDLAEFRDVVADLMARYLVRRLDEVDASTLVNELMDTAIRYKIRVPPDYALLAKAAVTIEGIVRSLKPDLDITTTILPYARTLMAEQYGPQAVKQMAMRAAVGLIDGVQELPLLGHQLVNDLESGRLTIRLAHDEIDKLGRSLNDLGTRLVLGLLAAGALVGTFIVAAFRPDDPDGTTNGWVWFGLLISLMLSGALVGWHVAYGRLGKIRLGVLMRWIGRMRERP